MIRLMRIAGFGLIIAGGLTLIGYFVEPLRNLWVLALALPTPILLGLAIAALGLLMLFGSLIYERWESREADRALRDD